MPLVAIDWARIEGGLHGEPGRSPAEELQRRTRPSRLLLASAGLVNPRRRLLPRSLAKGLRRLLERLHRAALVLVPLAVVGLSGAWPWTRGASRLGLLFSCRIGLAALGVAVGSAAELSGAWAALERLWDEATCAKAQLPGLRLSYSAALLSALLLALLHVATQSLLLFRPEVLHALPLPLNGSSGGVVVGSLGLVGVGLAELCTAGLSSLCLAYALVLVGELRALGEDMREERSLNQLAVLRHYLAIHHNLRSMLSRLCGELGLWSVGSLVLGLVGLSGWGTEAVEGGPTVEGSVGALGLVFHGALSAGLALRVEWAAQEALEAAEAAAVGPVAIQPDYHAVLAAYQAACRRSPALLSARRLFSLSSTSIIRLFACTVALTLLLHIV